MSSLKMASISFSLRNCISMAVLFFVFSGCNGKNILGSDKSNTSFENSAHKLVNEYRVSEGLDALKYSPFIADIARTHSQNMANGSSALGHEGFSERSDKIRDKLGGGRTAENVAYGYSSAERTVEGWIASDGHRKNMRGDFTHTGIGVAYDGDDQPYYTQIFLKK